MKQNPAFHLSSMPFRRRENWKNKVCTSTMYIHRASALIGLPFLSMLPIKRRRGKKINLRIPLLRNFLLLRRDRFLFCFVVAVVVFLVCLFSNVVSNCPPTVPHSFETKTALYLPYLFIVVRCACTLSLHLHSSR